jgi:hypothetical protein
MERDALATRLALAKAEMEKLHATAMSTNEALERATTAVAAAEATARDATHTAAQEKAVFEAKVADLERDLATVGLDLTTANRQFFQVVNQLQVASEEATWLRESNAKLSEDLEGESTMCFLSPFFSTLACLLFILTCLLVLQGCACTTQG